MTWTYTSSSLGTSSTNADLMAVRLTIGDTDTTDQQLQNEEIRYLLATYGGVTDASIHAAEALAAKYARQVDKKVGDLSISASAKVEHYTTIASSLRNSVSVAALPYAGGTSISRKETVAADSDRVSPSVWRGLHDDPSNPQSGGSLSSTAST